MCTSKVNLESTAQWIFDVNGEQVESLKNSKYFFFFKFLNYILTSLHTRKERALYRMHDKLSLRYLKYISNHNSLRNHIVGCGIKTNKYTYNECSTKGDKKVNVKVNNP